MSIPTDLQLPRPIPVKRCLEVILDGAVLRVGGPFTIASRIVARLHPDLTMISLMDLAADISARRAENPPVESITFDDEFCFDRESGCELATS